MTSLEWVLAHVDDKDAKPKDGKVENLLKWCRKDLKNRDWLTRKWVEAQLGPQHERDEEGDVAPLMRLVDDLLAEWKKGKT